jgi:hypothetical protein
MRSLGAVLSLFWIALVVFSSWYGITIGSRKLDWLVRIVSLPPEEVPKTTSIDGFGLYWQLVDPVPLFLMILVPLIVAWTLVALGRRLAGQT